MARGFCSARSDCWHYRPTPSRRVPEWLLSDRGPNFLSNLVEKVCQLLGTAKVNISGYHPQCDRFVEKFNSTLINMLSKTVGKHGDKHFPYVLFAYQSAVKDFTKSSPFYLVHMPGQVQDRAHQEVCSPLLLTIWGWITPTNAEVCFLNCPSDLTIFVSLDHVRKCYEEMTIFGWAMDKPLPTMFDGTSTQTVPRQPFQYLRTLDLWPGQGANRPDLETEDSSSLLMMFYAK